ncbi:MAG: aspartate ammonia-lyase [Thermomonas sp.]|uniref:aspartate ammonia-lyase n=1 Tax=Thermomonas sp. TaxID=1971895 RepID=UPI0026359AF1|nr:aspartate ammonia-lyase [Thermomonas sp.]MCC7096417.1 aspartate ammonia-lyase [Thermomonas sp.]
MTFRREHDLLGERQIPEAAYWGVHTLRARDNFPISGQPISTHPDLVVALAAIKQAAAQANHRLGLLDATRCNAIVQACEDIRAGQLNDQFVVDVIQGGAGTSTHMNANEVIANRALEILGHAKGDYTRLHPNEHVNIGQSTNDVYPTAVKLAAWAGAQRLLLALQDLRDQLRRKADAFAHILKVGRTQLQDAVPMTLGQEFGAFATSMDSAITQLGAALPGLCSINLGATAIGTGVTTHADYPETVRAELSALLGIELRTAADLVEATQDCDAFVALSAALKRLAIRLSKLCNDLRLLSSGPRTGLAEIRLPARQAGSSIMPGKVNPVIPEVVNQVCFQVIGNDLTITLAAEAGQLQLNAFEPIIACCLQQSLAHLTAAVDSLTRNCIEGIEADSPRIDSLLNASLAFITVLNPHLGYARTTEVALEALATGQDVRSIVLARGWLDDAQLGRILDPASATRPGILAAA